MTSEGWAYRLLGYAKRRAGGATKSRPHRRQGKIEFSLTREWVQERVDRGVCEVTGIPFDLRVHKGGMGTNPFAPSLDRIDNNGAYVPENVRVVIQIYNVAAGKYDKTALEFFIRHYGERLYSNGLGKG